MVPQSDINVLHVDDNRDFAELVSEFIEREDSVFNVRTAASANRGLNKLVNQTVDCIVSDYEMPEMDGIEFLNAVRDEYPDLPFILYTAKGSESIASEAISAGVTDYVQKRSGSDQYEILANRIRNAVERTRAQRDRQRHLDAIESAQEGVSILNEKGVFEYMNESYANLYGYDSNELIGEQLKTLFYESDIDRIQDELLSETEQREYWHGEVTGVRADGSTFIPSMTLAATDENCLVCTVRDGVARNANEQSIKELHNTIQTFMQADTAEQIAETAVNAVSGVLDLNSNGVYLYDESQERLVPVAWTAEAEALVGDLPTFTPDTGIAWSVFETGEAQVHSDVSTHSKRYNADTNVRSEIILPLGDHGVLLIGSDEFKAFDETDVDLAQTFAAHATTALDRISREQDLQQYKTLVEAAGDPMFIFNDDSRIEVANGAFLTYVNANEGAVIGSHVKDFINDKDFSQLTRLHSDLLEDPSNQWATREVATVTTTGEQRPSEINLSPLTDDAGNVINSIGVIRDISARKKREQSLEQLQRRTQALMHTSTRKETAQIAVEAAHDILEVPLAGCHLLGSDQRVLKPTAFVDSVREEIGDAPAYDRTVDDDPTSQVVWDAFESGERVVIDNVDKHDELAGATPAQSGIIHPVGEFGVFIASATEPNAFDDADLALTEIIATALTAALERVEREQMLERQNEQLDKFASVVSHDLRTPLNVAAGRVELAQRECSSDHLDEVAQAHERMEVLLEDLTKLAREGDSVKRMESVRLTDLTEECWQNVVTADATLVTEGEQVFQADAGRVKQLFENLFSNAVEHGNQDTTVTVGRLEGGNGFYIADNGPGIPEEIRDTVFSTGYSTSDKSNGLGLNIVEDIVDAHGWDITIVDAEGGGARFEITGIKT